MNHHPHKHDDDSHILMRVIIVVLAFIAYGIFKVATQ